MEIKFYSILYREAEQRCFILSGKEDLRYNSGLRGLVNPKVQNLKFVEVYFSGC